MKCELVIVMVVLMLTSACSILTEKRMNRKDNIVDNYFGHEVADPYRWLENDTSEETLAWVKMQNARTRKVLDGIENRKEIAARLREIWSYARKSSPWKVGEKYFYSKNDGLRNQSVYYMADKLGEEGRIVLDPNSMSDDGTVALTEISVSPDARYMGYGIARNGSDWNEFYVRDLESLVDLNDTLLWIKFSSIVWYKGGFFYSRYPQPREGDELTAENVDNAIYYHKLNTCQAQDVKIFEDKERNNRSFDTSLFSDENVLVITVTESTSGNALYVLDLNRNDVTVKGLCEPYGEVKRLIDTCDKDYLPLGIKGNMIYVMTNSGASNYRIAALDMSSVSAGKREIIIEESNDAIAHAAYRNGRFYVNYMHDAHTRIVVYDADGKNGKEVELPGIGSVDFFSPEKDEDEFCFTFSSYTIAPRSYIYKVSTNEIRPLEGWNADVNLDLEQYETKQVFCKSKDGVRIPIFLTYKKGVVLDGNNPVWLYGYGGFNISLTPYFDVRMLYWLENGGIYAVANIRGGGEYGEVWHQGGTKQNKQNVFDDFISAAQYMIDEGYTKPDLMVCQGGSNGGLLIGAVINQAPELFRVAFPQVGVMDMLRYHKFTIGRYWATDYGTSEDSEEMFKYLLSYSPIHNIGNKNYPSVMVMTADHDDRVVPAHSFKYAATLQEKYEGERPMLIRIESQAGHGAGKPISKQIDEWADIYAFAIKELGLWVKN